MSLLKSIQGSGARSQDGNSVKQQKNAQKEATNGEHELLSLISGEITLICQFN